MDRPATGIGMGENIVYFDLETQRSAGDVGGWDHKEKMGMSLGVTYSTATGGYRIYAENEAEELVNELTGADLVIGFNHVGFDYAVLQAYTMWNLEERTKSLDLLVDLEKVIGHRIKLDALATASLGKHKGKTADGLDAIKWWREGRMLEIAEYCCYDVKITKLVHEFGARHGFVRFENRFGQIVQAEVNWTLPEGVV